MRGMVESSVQIERTPGLKVKPGGLSTLDMAVIPTRRTSRLTTKRVKPRMTQAIERLMIQRYNDSADPGNSKAN